MGNLFSGEERDKTTKALARNKSNNYLMNYIITYIHVANTIYINVAFRETRSSRKRRRGRNVVGCIIITITLILLDSHYQLIN